MRDAELVMVMGVQVSSIASDVVYQLRTQHNANLLPAQLTRHILVRQQLHGSFRSDRAGAVHGVGGKGQRRPEIGFRHMRVGLQQLGKTPSRSEPA